MGVLVRLCLCDGDLSQSKTSGLGTLSAFLEVEAWGVQSKYGLGNPFERGKKSTLTLVVLGFGNR